MSVLHIGTEITLAEISVVDINNGDIAYIWLNDSVRKMVFDSVSTRSEDTINHPYYIRPDDYSTSGVWIEEVGADQPQAWNGAQIRTGSIQSVNWEDGVSGATLNLDDELIAIIDDTFGNNGIQIGYIGGAAKAYFGDGTDSFLKFDGTNLTWKAANTELDASGNLIATSATLSGEVTAESGEIGGWQIGTDYIRDAAGVVGLSSAVTAGDDIRFWAGHATPSAAPFRVTESGALVATSATLSGEVTATSGTIGGFTIDETEGVYAGSGATRVQMKAGVGFWTGATAQADALSYLDVDGSGWFADGNFSWDTDGNVTFGDSESFISLLDGELSITLKNLKVFYLPDQTDFNGTFILGTGGTNLTHSSGLEGQKNILLGLGSAYSLTTGFSNTAIGTYAAYSNQVGNYWTAIGERAGYENTASFWTAIGSYAGRHNTLGEAWIAIGNGAAYKSTTGDHWISIGSTSAYLNTTGNNWIAIGYQAAYINSVGNNWLAIGCQAGYANDVGENWVAIGYRSAYANVNKSYWVAIGIESAYSSITGERWMALGYKAGYSNTNGNSWMALGYKAGYSNTNGSAWAAIGDSAGYYNASGSSWVAVGQQAAVLLVSGSNATSFSNSVYIGNNTRVSANGVTNENVFGHGAYGAGSNSIMLGNASITKTIMRGGVGINTTTPSAYADLTLENGVLCMKETTTPTADTNYGKIYFKNDNRRYYQDGAGTEHQIAHNY